MSLCSCEKCDKKIIHRVRATNPFAYTDRYIPVADPNILFPLVSVAVTVEGPFNEQGVVMRVENIRAIIEKLIIRPWAFSILVYKKQLPVPQKLIDGAQAKVVVVDFIPSVEGTANYIFQRIKRKIEENGVKLVSVDVASDFDGTFLGSALAD